MSTQPDATGPIPIPSDSDHLTKLTLEELDQRRLQVENTVGTMRIEDMEPDETTMTFLNSYAHGEIEFEETIRLMREYSRTVM
jgi:hypothetical protein